MTELIKITKDNSGKEIVSARELYFKLGFAIKHYAKWYDKNLLSNEFAIVNEDYSELPLSGRSKDFAITLDFAKRICMMTRTKKGEEVRQYFLECEKKVLAKSTLQIPANFSEALLLAYEQQKIIEKLTPRSLYFDKMINTDGLVSMQEVAKLLNINDMGRNKMFQKLRIGNIIMKNSTTPYQHFVNKGYFELKEEIVVLKENVRKVNVTTYATQKGLAFIFKFFGLTEQK